MLPTLFVSHGAPTLPLTECPARDFIVAVNETIHDFYGFPEALYRIRYPAPGSPQLATRVIGSLEANGLHVSADNHRGLDHGAWVPLLLMYPEHDIPTVQLSIQSRLGPAHHIRLGQAIAGLREDVLIMCTGSFTHNLRLMDRSGVNAPEPQWVGDFSDYMDAALVGRRREDLLNYRQLAPFAARAHPEDDHFMPLFVAVGAGGDNPRPRRLHSSTTYGTLRMDSYAFA